MSISKIAIAASFAAALTGAAGSASAQDYGRRTGGGLGSVVSCDAQGHTQAGGALIGALLGAAAGSNLSRDRTAGSLIGAALGAAAGSYAGCAAQRGAIGQTHNYGQNNGYGYGAGYHGRSDGYRGGYRQQAYGGYGQASRYQEGRRYDQPQAQPVFQRTYGEDRSSGYGGYYDDGR